MRLLVPILAVVAAAGPDATRTAGIVALPTEETAGILPEPTDVGILFPARGLSLFSEAGDPLLVTLKLRTALTPPPGIQQDRALVGWEAALASHPVVPVPGSPPHRYPVRVSRIRPAGPTLVYRFQLEVPAWVPPDLYDLEMAGPGFASTRAAAVRIVDTDRARPLAGFACEAGAEPSIPESAWDVLDAEGLVLRLDDCPEAAIDPLQLPGVALLTSRPGRIARDLFRLLVGPSRWAMDVAGLRVLAADGDAAFARAERSHAREDGRTVLELPGETPRGGRAVLLGRDGGTTGHEWNPVDLSVSVDGLVVDVRAPAGVPLVLSALTDGAAWRLVSEDGPVSPFRVAPAGPIGVPGVPEAAVLYFSVRPGRYRLVRHDVRPPVASLWIDRERTGGRVHRARVGRKVVFEVRSDEAAAVSWDFDRQTGETALGPRVELSYRSVGPHYVTAVVLGERGNRRTLTAELDVGHGGGHGCSTAPDAPNWTYGLNLGILLLARNSRRGARRSGPGK